MLPELLLAYNSAKNALDLVRGVSKLSHDAELATQGINLSRHILDAQARISEAQAKYDEMADINRELKAEIAKRNDWDREAARYELAEIAPNILAFSLRKDAEPKQPHHWLCPVCYEEKKKSFLQPSRSDSLFRKCHQCEFEVRIPNPSGYKLIADDPEEAFG